MNNSAVISFLILLAALLASNPSEALTCTGGSCVIFPNAANTACQAISGILSALGYQTTLTNTYPVLCNTNETKCAVITFKTTNSNGDVFYVKTYRCATESTCQTIAQSIGTSNTTSGVITNAYCCADPSCVACHVTWSGALLAVISMGWQLKQWTIGYS